LTSTRNELIFTNLEYIFTTPEAGVERKKRLSLVAALISSARIAGQEELAAALLRKGLSVSQASLSRDLRDLGAVKVRSPEGSLVYALPDERPAAATTEHFARRFATSATGVRRSGFVLLVFTPPGEASLAGRLLDQASLPGLLGSVAGDDTIVCVCESAKSAMKLEKKLLEIIK
jgi:transcriptional regulator of arginine metabolism